MIVVDSGQKTEVLKSEVGMRTSEKTQMPIAASRLSSTRRIDDRMEHLLKGPLRPEGWKHDIFDMIFSSDFIVPRRLIR